MLVEIEMLDTAQRVSVDPSVARRMIREGRAYLAGPIFSREDMIAVLGHNLRMVPVSAERLWSAGV